MVHKPHVITIVITIICRSYGIWKILTMHISVLELSFREGRAHIVSTRALCERNFAMRAQKVPFSYLIINMIKGTFGYF